MRKHKAAWLSFFLFTTNMVCHADEEHEPVVDPLVTVSVAHIQKKTLSRYVEAYGLVEPEPAIHGKHPASSKVSSPVAGLITHVWCEEGAYVKQGTVLFELDARSADEAMAKAEVALAFAQKNFERKQQLYSNNNTSLKLYQEAEQQLEAAQKELSNARTQREILRIRAPLSGTIATLYYKTGESINVNSVLADLMDLKRLDVALKIPTAEIQAVQPGQPVEVYVESGTDSKPYLGSVHFISPQVDSSTDTVLVRAGFASDARIRPGQFVHARIRLMSKPDRLAVPQSSVIHGRGLDYVMLVSGQRAKKVVVTTGIKEDGWVELSGAALSSTMQVVVVGAYGLPDHSRIRIQK